MKLVVAIGPMTQILSSLVCPRVFLQDASHVSKSTTPLPSSVDARSVVVRAASRLEKAEEFIREAMGAL